MAYQVPAGGSISAALKHGYVSGEWYVTAVKDGVESAPSNKVTF